MKKTIIQVLEFHSDFPAAFGNFLVTRATSQDAINAFMAWMTNKYTNEALIMLSADRGTYRPMFPKERFPLGNKNFGNFYDLCAFLALQVVAFGPDHNDLNFDTPFYRRGVGDDLVAGASIAYRHWRKMVGTEYIPFLSNYMSQTFGLLTNCKTTERHLHRDEHEQYVKSTEMFSKGAVSRDMAQLRARMGGLMALLETSSLDQSSKTRGVSLIEGIVHESSVVSMASATLLGRYERVTGGHRDHYWFANEISNRLPIPLAAICDRLVALGYLLHFGGHDVHAQYRAEALSYYQEGLVLREKWAASQQRGIAA